MMLYKLLLLIYKANQQNQAYNFHEKMGTIDVTNTYEYNSKNIQAIRKVKKAIYANLVYLTQPRKFPGKLLSTLKEIQQIKDHSYFPTSFPATSI